MIHRLALAIGAITATGILAFAAGVASVTPPTLEMELTAEQGKAPAADSGAPSMPPAGDEAVVQQTVTDTVYVEAVPEPEVVVVDRPRRAARNQPAPQANTSQPSADPTSGSDSSAGEDADDDEWDDEDEDDGDEDDGDEDDGDDDGEDEPGDD